MKTKIVRTLILGALALTTLNAFAEQSMRRCMLLPIMDSVGGAMGFKTFENLEEYLKEGGWCYYRSNSEIINILGSYKQNLGAHLQNKEVLKVIADKTGAGSLIKVELRSEVKGVNVKVMVFGENGEDIYFKEETRLNTDDITVIAQTVKNWLAVFEKTIPYDGKVMGVLGDQFSIDTGKMNGMNLSADVTVLRPVKKRAHPLLKEIIDWETEKIAKAKVFNVTESQSQAKVSEYEGRKRLKVGDWVRVDKPEATTLTSPPTSTYDDVKGYEFGKLGVASLDLMLGKASMSNTNASGSKRSMGGTIYGVDLNVELWATRNWWGAIEIARSMGSLSKDEGTLTSESSSYSESLTKLKFGYRFLPLGFFYGPQVDAYGGYLVQSYGPDRNVNDGFVEATFKGLYFGAKGSIPMDKEFRLFLSLDFMPFPGYEEDSRLYGEADSASNYHLEFGGSYAYSPSMNIEASWNFAQSKANFVSPDREVRFSDSYLKIGAAFNF